jgi:hypothetical protein
VCYLVHYGNLTLNGNYETIIGNQKGLFLIQCINYFSSLTPGKAFECVDVYPGSIILILRTFEVESTLNSAFEHVDKFGFNLPSFPAMKSRNLISFA